MKRPLLIFGATLFFASALPADEIKWGQPVNGLRIGVEASATAVTSDQKLLFKITAQNVSLQPITVPTPQSFVHKVIPESDYYFESPLEPIVETTRFAPPSDQFDSPTRGGYSDTPIDKYPLELIELSPGQSVTWEQISLTSRSYCADRSQDGKQILHQSWNLLPGYIFHIHFRFENENSVLSEKSAWVGQADSGVTDLKIDFPSTEGIKLEGGFSLPKLTYYLGEGILTTFTVANKGQTPITFPTGGDYAYSGRHDLYSITAMDEQGRAVPDPVRTPGGGGAGSGAKIGPGTRYTESMLVNQWCAFSRPGHYKVTFKRTLVVMRDDPSNPYFFMRPSSNFPHMTIETTLDITIRDKFWTLSGWHDALVNLIMPQISLMKNFSTWDRSAALLKSNAAAQIPETFPKLVSLLDGAPEAQTLAVESLPSYGLEKAAPVLLAHAPTLAPRPRQAALNYLGENNVAGVEPLLIAALRDPDPELRANTVLLCSRRWYGSCVPILLSMSNDSNVILRRYLGSALGASGDNRAIPVLIKLLHDPDPDPFIKIWAADGLGQFKRMEGVPVLIDLLRTGAVRGEEGNVTMVLNRLTSQDFHENPKSCLDWWDKTGRAQYDSNH